LQNGRTGKEITRIGESNERMERKSEIVAERPKIARDKDKSPDGMRD
jgi:hypothetical protein